jgi:hypothetical protein
MGELVAHKLDQVGRLPGVGSLQRKQYEAERRIRDTGRVPGGRRALGREICHLVGGTGNAYVNVVEHRLPKVRRQMGAEGSRIPL